jgi:hypothetical protein
MAADPTTQENAQLLAAITELVIDNADTIAVPATALNRFIAQLSQTNSRSLVKVQGALIKSIDQAAIDNNNAIDQLGLAILAPLNDWFAENQLLLTQLAASAGLTQPGDPLEKALLQSVADEPELAYSATLLIALRDFRPLLADIAEALREIRDRLPPLTTRTREEAPATGDPEAIVVETDPRYASLGAGGLVAADYPLT